MIAIGPVYVQAVAATAGFGRVDFQSQIVGANEPIKSALRVLVPPNVGGGAKGFETSRDGSLRFNRLLIEDGSDAAPPVETIAADGPEMTLLGHLQFGQPAQSGKASLQYGLLSSGLTAYN